MIQMALDVRLTIYLHRNSMFELVCWLAIAIVLVTCLISGLLLDGMTHFA